MEIKKTAPALILILVNTAIIESKHGASSSIVLADPLALD